MGVPVAWVLLILGSYLLGTFPTAIVVGRRKGVDPTKEGSGNPGATNMYRTAGKSAGAIVLVGDMLKGLIIPIVGLAVDGRPLAMACWAAAVVGHIFPVFRGFRGGKGMATAGGGVIPMFWYVALIGISVFAATVKVTKRGSLGSLAACAAVPLLAAAFGRPGWEVGVAAGIFGLCTVRHWSNIKRLITGREAAVVGRAPR
ncbi:MAG: glycerol-3-phosphate 1-O-acyltransferase PlsY [Actinobacteria bacterium]|nr:glycerol-3-phosphate 1-O-acyltransferase PlsY [Actinomycetota bacterium]MSY13366.1 glycerol-3-phosphate 1-O-acyltransferase PlsY [Actinomycetota bacterium]MSZ04941.1 glycerol-3-phosphate 1-O-acyltransferase PlsY [Actinomycetota bacterium]